MTFIVTDKGYYSWDSEMENSAEGDIYKERLLERNRVFILV